MVVVAVEAVMVEVVVGVVAAVLFCSVPDCILPQRKVAHRISPSTSLFIPLPATPQCHLSNDALYFQLISLPLSATLCY